MSAFVWLFGRGVAKAFGFAWQVPQEHYAGFARGDLSRAELERRIRDGLGAFQRERRLDAERVKRFVSRLPAGCEHRFVTTNWNTLLDRELAAHGHRVWHLNGSLDDPHTPLMTELERHERYDHAAFRALLHADACVLAGLSLKSGLDQGTLERLCAETACPRRWVVVNPDPAACPRLPGRTLLHPKPFEDWIEEGLPGL